MADINNHIRQINQQEWALFIIRLALGATFFLHGSQKVFGWFGGPGLEGFVNWAGTFGIPSTLAYLAAFAEFIGGCLMFAGIATEVGAILSIGVMLGAIFLIHWPKYFVQNGGFEYPLMLIIFSIALIIGGPGKYVIWDPFKRCRDKYL